MRKVLFLFGELRDSDVDWLAQVGHRLTLEPGDFLMHQGKEDENVYIVLEGELEVTVTGIGQVARLEAGEVVGEMSFVSSLLPSADVIGKTPCRVLAVPRQLLRARIEEDHDFGMRFYRAIAVFLADRLRGTVQRFGYGGYDRSDLEPPVHELDDNVLDTVYLAGLRFERLVNLLATAA
jgi:CRP/FNR family cyclic AMP-dependent transcriptional regulator